MKMTPVLFVEAVEPSLPFWIALGFRKVAEVPEGDRIGFAMLEQDGVEVMLQSFDSLRKDAPAAVAKGARPEVGLYVEVADVEAARARLGGAEVVIPLRDAFYGMREIGVRTPSGHLLTLAQRLPAKD
jgi:uncharacterized glyoxalase superfamily protein PhnB